MDPPTLLLLCKLKRIENKLNLSFDSMNNGKYHVNEDKLMNRTCQKGMHAEQ